ncbi:hypothetical protein [Haloferax sp. Atlit-19N]|uniref:hypothetical protein n=1 Tax=Haloferax sp. Atlit-19N TaxID=2077201 RepID=UPI0011C0388F|nr:hypothetical protein [Haloferax sp. Atlit-19N]
MKGAYSVPEVDPKLGIVAYVAYLKDDGSITSWAGTVPVEGEFVDDDGSQTRIRHQEAEQKLREFTQPSIGIAQETGGISADGYETFIKQQTSFGNCDCGTINHTSTLYQNPDAQDDFVAAETHYIVPGTNTDCSTLTTWRHDSGEFRTVWDPNMERQYIEAQAPPRGENGTWSWGGSIGYMEAAVNVNYTQPDLYSSTNGDNQEVGIEFSGFFNGSNNETVTLHTASRASVPSPWATIANCHTSWTFADGYGEETFTNKNPLWY